MYNNNKNTISQVKIILDFQLLLLLLLYMKPIPLCFYAATETNSHRQYINLVLLLTIYTLQKGVLALVNRAPL